MRVKNALISIFGAVLFIAWLLFTMFLYFIAMIGYCMARAVGYASLLFRNRCEYWTVCPYYEESSYTCQHGGGSYCGMWRRFKGWV